MANFSISPRFDVNEIVNESIKRNWFEFQEKALELGQDVEQYMQNYINAHRKRTGGTGNLAKLMKLEVLSTAPARIEWGIGDINVLNQQAPYWYVVNYGKTTSGQKYIPNYGNFVPGKYRGGDGRPDASQRGRGTEGFQYQRGAWGMYPSSPIRPMHYISVASAHLKRKLRSILTSISRGK